MDDVDRDQRMKAILGHMSDQGVLTEVDLSRMDQIAQELRRFQVESEMTSARPGGNAKA